MICGLRSGFHARVANTSMSPVPPSAFHRGPVSYTTYASFSLPASQFNPEFEVNIQKGSQSLAFVF